MGRNPQQNARMLNARRDKILAAALQLFATRGLGATRIKDIAQRADMSLGLVYHYFASKEEVFVALVTSAFEKLNQAVTTLETMPGSPLDKIRTAFEGLVRGFMEIEGSAWYHLLIAQATISDATPEAAKNVIGKERDKPYQALARIIAEGQLNGSIAPGNPETMAMVFWTTIKGLALHRAVHGEAFRPPDIEILMKMFI